MFGTSGIRGTVGETVTARLAVDLGRAVAAEGASLVVVGRDARTTGGFLADAVSAGLRESGADVIRLGVVSTPTLARAVGWTGADAGVVVTASHNPPTDNGLKLWNPNGLAFTTEQRSAISRRIVEEDFDLVDFESVGHERHAPDVIDRHVETLVYSNGSLEGLEVVVDVGNGTGLVTANALTEAGATVRTLNAQPDGTFPGRPSEPTAENCTELCRLVGATDADLGIAHDGDADRMMAVDETGRFVDGDQLLAVFADASTAAGDAVTVPINTSMAVDDFLARKDVSVLRTPVGDGFIAERARDEGAVFGGEPSGAWIWPAETLCPDGPLAAVTLARLVHRMGALSSLVDRVEQYPIRRRSIEVADKGALLESVTRRLEREYGDVVSLDGVRVETADGWFLVRASGTEPLVRVTAEARRPERSEELLEMAVEHLEAARVTGRV